MIAEKPMTVSVVIPTFNRPEMAERAVESALSQVPLPRVIVVDDGSHLAMTPRVTALAAAGKIILLRQANRGLSAARNHGVSQTDTTHLLFLDDDDQLVPGAIAGLLATQALHRDAPIVAGGGRRIFADGRIGPMEWPEIKTGDFDELIGGNPFFVGAVLVRREDFIAVGGFEEQERLAEDWDLWLRLVRRGAIACAPVHVVDYYVHGQNVSTSSRITGLALAVAEKWYRALTVEERRRLGPKLATYIVQTYADNLAWYLRGSLRRGRIADLLRELRFSYRLIRLAMRHQESRDMLRDRIRAHLASSKAAKPLRSG